jgi:catechol 2,3-dioxygenase-like lactoylglutathione lyase family enzyme
MSNNNVPNMKLELVPIPTSDLDRAKEFYVEKMGFNCDHDVTPAEGMRVVQMTPPGSACSIAIAKGLPDFEKMRPGNVQGLHLVVADIVAAREALLRRGVEVAEVVDMGGVKYAAFSDPDGNSWTLQEMPAPASPAQS